MPVQPASIFTKPRNVFSSIPYFVDASFIYESTSEPNPLNFCDLYFPFSPNCPPIHSPTFDPPTPPATPPATPPTAVPAPGATNVPAAPPATPPAIEPPAPPNAAPIRLLRSFSSISPRSYA